MIYLFTWIYLFPCSGSEKTPLPLQKNEYTFLIQHYCCTFGLGKIKEWTERRKFRLLSFGPS